MPTTLPNLPNLAGTNVTPNVPTHVLADTDITVVNSSATLGIGADRKVTLGELKASIVTPITTGDNVFSGKNSFTKTLGFSVVSFGSSDSSSTPMESLSKDSPAVFNLTGYGIIYCDFLTPGYSPVRCTVINSVNKGLSISGLSGTIRKIFQNGTHLDIAVVHDSMTGISDLAVELIWDGSVLNVVSLAEYKPSKSIGMSATIGEPGDLPRVLRTTGSNDHSVSLADPTLCDGYSCTILRGDAGVLTLSWVFTGTFPVLCWAKGESSWVTHATGFSASSSALLFDVYSSGGEWWIRES